MTTRVEWDDEEHTIIRLDLAEGHTWREYHEAVQTVIEMAKQTPGRVDVIINNPYGLPAGNPLPHLRRSVLMFTSISNLGVVVSINPRQLPGFIQSLVDIVVRAAGLTVQRGGFVNTVDEARQRIREKREEAANA